MSAPRPTSRPRPSQAPDEASGRLRGWWEAIRGLVTVPSPGRLATLGGLAALTVALMAILVERTKGGFDRAGLRHLASETHSTVAPPRPGYIKR